MDNNYLGNPNLKKANVKVEWTEEQLLEYKKCMDNPQYFIEEYVKIIFLVSDSYKHLNKVCLIIR